MNKKLIATVTLILAAFSATSACTPVERLQAVACSAKETIKLKSDSTLDRCWKEKLYNHIYNNQPPHLFYSDSEGQENIGRIVNLVAYMHKTGHEGIFNFLGFFIYHVCMSSIAEINPSAPYSVGISKDTSKDAIHWICEILGLIKIHDFSKLQCPDEIANDAAEWINETVEIVESYELSKEDLRKLTARELHNLCGGMFPKDVSDEKFREIAELANSFLSFQEK